MSNPLSPNYKNISISITTHKKLIDFVTARGEIKVNGFCDKAISQRIDFELNDFKQVSVEDILKWKEAFDRINHNNY